MAIIPGKWQVFTLDSGTVVVRSQDGDTEYMVAKVWGDDDGNKISTASLIAAAPELLTALLAALASFQELDSGWRDMDATLVDQIIATNLYAIKGVVSFAEWSG